MPRRMTPKLIKDYTNHNFAYERFAPNGQLHIVCPQCRAPIVLFEGLSEEIKGEIAELRRRSPVLAMKRLQQAAGCELNQAKANVLHLRDEESRCHWCGFGVPAGALLCAQCMSVNLDW